MLVKKVLTIAFVVLITSGLMAQNTNPYEIFGYHSTNEITYKNDPLAVYLRIKNLDSTSTIKELAFDFRYGYIYFYGENDSVLKTVSVPPDRLLRFISIDPIAKNYPGNSPYAFAENDVIRAIDLEGLEKFIRNYQGFQFEFDTENPQSVSIKKVTASDVQQTIVLNFNTLNATYGTSSMNLFAPHTSQQIGSRQGFVQSPFFPNQSEAEAAYSPVKASIDELSQRFSTGEREYATRVLAEFIGQSEEVQLNIVGNYQFSSGTRDVFMTTTGNLLQAGRRQAPRLFTEQRAQTVANAFFSPGGQVPSGILTRSRLDFPMARGTTQAASGVTLSPIGKDPFGSTLFFKFNIKKEPIISEPMIR